MTSARRRQSPLLLEMLLIVVAIVLGFALTSWDTARRERIRSEDAVARIRQELEANRAALATAVPYYSGLLVALDSILGEDGDGPFDPGRVPGWRGISPPSLRTASFTVATSTGVLERVDFEIADQIALAYEGLSDFSDVLSYAMGATMNGNVRSTRDWRMVISFLGEVAAGAEATVAITAQLLAPG